MPLDGLRGHRELANRLFAELRVRPSHAYLFSGPRGVGKALVAESLAHSLLCERSPGEKFCCTPDRCPERMNAALPARGRASAAVARCECCAACVQVAGRVHPDFSYVARPAGRTDVLIEQVRDLIAQLGIRSSRGERRIAIIDDAETLNLPAQNAMLKTLEEPPGQAIIFMITSSERALLDTIRSRMRPVRFGALAPADIEQILAARGVATGDRAAAIARLARGSAARAIALASGEEPPIKELLAALGAAKSLDFVRAQALAQEFFANRDQAAANFELLARLFEEILCYKLLGEESAGAPNDDTTPTKALADKLPVEAIVSCLGSAIRAVEAVEAMANSRLQAEQWWVSAGQAMRGEQ
jgi:DNA polymerase III subunit delta'